jgi:hypothetical protein
MTDVANHHNPARLWPLMFGACATPLVWLGQMMLGYGLSAYVCYPADHPLTIAAPGQLTVLLIAFDVAALAVCIAAAMVSWATWKKTREQKQGRVRFMALWGLISSLWFFVAILFNVIVSVSVPPCVG